MPITMMAEPPLACYQFGPYHIDPVRRRLSRGGVPIQLRPKAFDLLLTLALRSGTDVDKDELLRLVWPDATVEENNLPHTISKLRKALDEHLDEHRYIVTVPGRGYRFVAPVRAVGAARAAAIVRRETEPPAPPGIMRLIVLPFRLLRPDPDVEFLTFSLPDAITVALSGLESLVVRSSATAAQFAVGRADPGFVGTRAAVDVMLTGTLLRAGDRLRLTTQLVAAPSGAVVWSQATQAALGDLLRLHDDLVQQIVASLAVPLSVRDQRLLDRDLSKRTTDPGVYAAYLRGRYYFNRRTPDAMKRALACFEAAIAGDAAYAPAYAGLSDCYMLGGAATLSRQDSLNRARRAASRALELDDELAEAHASLAAVAFRWDWDWRRAEDEFVRAVQLNPGAPAVRHAYALFLAAMTRFGEALIEMTRALDLDPLSLVASVGLGRVLDLAGRYDEAIDQYRKTLEIDPSFAEAHFDLSLALGHAGRHDEALAAAERSAALAPDSIVYAENVAYLHALTRSGGKAEAFLDELAARASSSYVSPFLQAHLLLALGRMDEALQRIDEAVRVRAPEVVYLGVDSDWRPLQSDPRFEQVLRRLAFPEQPSAR